MGEGERQGHREKKNTVRKIHEAYKGRKWGQIVSVMLGLRCPQRKMGRGARRPTEYKSEKAIGTDERVSL